MKFKSIRVRGLYLHVDVDIPLDRLQMFKIVSGENVLMWCARDNERYCDCNDVDGLASGSVSISEDDYKMLAVVLGRFKENPLAFEGNEVLDRDSWTSIITQEEDHGQHS